MRHYSTMIDSLLDQEDYAEIKNITGHINEVVNENKVDAYCENRVVNTILMKMAEQANSLIFWKTLFSTPKTLHPPKNTSPRKYIAQRSTC